MNLTNVVNVVRGILKLRGGTDNTIIGNTGDALKVTPVPASSANSSYDVFLRQRTSSPASIINYTCQNSKLDALFNESITGTASSSFIATSSACRLTVGTASGDSIIRQTKRYMKYTAGLSYSIYLSGVIGAKKTNVRQRFGYFDANDGVFFEQTGTDFAVVRRTSTSGSPVDVRVVQSSWNLDKLDGTGTSGYTLDTTKHNLYVIDFSWLGAGKVRFGVYIGDSIVYCHQILTGNTLSTPYMSSPSRPLRWELTNTGASASSTNLDFVCTVAIKEDSNTGNNNFRYSASRLDTKVTVASTIRPVISIRPKATFNGITNRIPIKPVDFQILGVQNSLIYRIILNPTLTGASFTSAGTSSAVEYDISATAFTGGTVIAEGFCPGGGKGDTSSIEGDDTLILGLNFAGTTADIITIVALSLPGGNTDTYGIIGWEEYQ